MIFDLKTKAVFYDGMEFEVWDSDPDVVGEVLKENNYDIQGVPEGGVVVDIGAHIGAFSIYCAVKRGCRVYSFEPGPSCDLLRRNIERNHVEDRITVMRCAVCGFTGKTRLGFNTRNTCATSMYPSESDDVVDSEVPCITIADAFMRAGIYPSSGTFCDVLKMDCEGSERQIFADNFGSCIELARKIIMEWHLYDGHIYKLFLERRGYTVRLSGCGDPPPPYDPTFARGVLLAEKKTV